MSQGSTTFLSSDYSIPVSLRAPSILSASRAEEYVTQPIDISRTALSTRFIPKYALASELPAIESSNRLWKVKKILQRGTARGRGLRAKRAKRYLVQWTESWLSTEELRYARKAWKVVKTSQDRHSGKGEALNQNKTKVTWAPSWVSAVEHASTSDAE